MVVTPDVIGVIIAAFGGAATLLAGVAGLNSWMLKRLEDRIGDRFDKVESRLDRVEGELVEVKIAIARIEGPQPRLLRPSH